MEAVFISECMDNRLKEHNLGREITIYKDGIATDTMRFPLVFCPHSVSWALGNNPGTSSQTVSSTLGDFPG